jgi:ATP-dependent DNA ligase
MRKVVPNLDEVKLNSKNIRKLTDILGKKLPKMAEVIPAAELGGILNSTLAEAERKKREKSIAMRNAIFDIYVRGKEPVPRSVPYKKRVEMIKELLLHLPKRQFHLPRMETTPEGAKQMWEEIKAGKNPRTREGMVAWINNKPHKAKLQEESDVHITDIFPQIKGDTSLAGGFRYALKSGGDPVGKVGTGFSADVRKQMMLTPEDFIGRVARIQAQEQFPSGAYRAPAFLALHEDY